MSFNKIILVGNLGRDPELRYTAQGTPVCSFSLATNERKKDRSGESQDVTTWFRVTLWNRLAETASQYLTKGQSVYVEGRLRLEEWTDKEGKTRQSLEVHATDMQFISGRSGDAAHANDAAPNFDAQSSTQSPRPATAAAAASPTARPAADSDLNDTGVSDEDIPF